MVGIRTEVTLVPSGRGLVVRKQRYPNAPAGANIGDQVGPDPMATTEVEARWLQQAGHPGVVRLHWVSLRQARIETEHVGVATLAAGRLPEAATASALASVCRTLHDLQTRRLVHGNLTADHIIVAGAARPLLCSPRGDAVPTDDLLAVGRIVEGLTARWNHHDDGWSAVMEALLGAGPILNVAQAAAAFDEMARRTRKRWTGPARVLRK